MRAVLGKHIKKLRTERDLTQEKVADVLGISRQRYARIENGISNINLPMLTNLANLFGITVGDITKVLDEAESVEARSDSGTDDFNKIFAMLDLFYANKRMYNRIVSIEEEKAQNAIN